MNASRGAYYNEFDPYAAQWLRNLIAKGLIPAGDVDERSIVDVSPDDLAGYRQCHFFAGIGGWALACRLAGWPDDREIWTGSPPCQPFSVAGKGKAQADDRHLWPHLFRLIRARRPACFMGEQVAAAVGKDWLDGVLSDLESIGYAGRAVVVPACAVDAPHRRDRLWFVAHADDAGPQGQHRHELRAPQGRGEPPRLASAPGLLDRAERAERALADTSGGRRGEPGAGEVEQPRRAEAIGSGDCGYVADANDNGREPRDAAAETAGHGRTTQSICGIGAWDHSGWIIGHDGKARRVEPSIRLLAHGVSGRMAVVRPGFEGRTEVPEALHWYSRSGALKGFGNAIVPQVAAEVIAAYMDCAP